MNADLRVLIDAGSATTYEAAGRRGALAAAIRALTPAGSFGGRALPVLCHPGDNLAVHRAVADAKPGEILVIDGGGVLVGYLGDILGEAALARGVVGAIVDGGVRDLAALSDLGFPVWARSAAIHAASKRTPGVINDVAVCGGVAVAPGDWVVADIDGVVAGPAAQLEIVAGRVKERLADEAQIKTRLRAGELTLDLLNLRAFVSENRTGGRPIPER